MKKLLFLILVLIGSTDLYSQCNLVLNPGAEDGGCPTNQDAVSNATFWNKAGGTPDYFGKGCGSDWTVSYYRTFSNRMIGLYTEWTPYNTPAPEFREYAQAQLSSPLIAGTKYCVSFYARLAANMAGINTATDNLGAYFTNTVVTAPSPGYVPFNINPQIESPKGVPIVAASGWTLVSGSFIAVGGEWYVTFGNFHNLANTTYSNPTANMRSYYFIDDIMVKNCNDSCSFSVNISVTDSVCAGLCTNIFATVTGGNGGPHSYTWIPNIGTGLGPHTVCPTSNTTYSLIAYDSTGCCQTVVSSKTIKMGATLCTGINKLESSNRIIIYPNPNNGNMLLDYNLKNSEKGIISIYDITGVLVAHYQLDNANKQLSINNENFKNGIYFYQIKVNDQLVQSDKLVIIK